MPTESTAEKLVPAAQYAAKVDDLCLQLVRDIEEPQRQLQKLIQSGDSDTAKMEKGQPILAAQLVAISAFRKKIEAVGTPSEHADDAELMIEKSKGAETELALAIDALEQEDVSAFTQAMSRYAGYATQSATIAQESELNFAICGGGA